MVWRTKEQYVYLGHMVDALRTFSDLLIHRDVTVWGRNLNVKDKGDSTFV